MASRATASSRSRTRQPEQLPLFKKRGGKRRGAGRPPNGTRAGSPHQTRPLLHHRFPVHVVLRTVSALGNLRRGTIYRAIQQATLTSARRESFRIIHLSVQRNHLHLIVEANDKTALARGMQGFQISAARHVNRALGARRGTVFPDRYHAESIRSPRQARHVLSYVLLNWRKHGEDRNEKTCDWKIDWFSSAVMFPDWAEYGHDEVFLWRGPPSYEPLLVFRPRTWLLREGWKKHGATISCRERPSIRT